MLYDFLNILTTTKLYIKRVNLMVYELRAIEKNMKIQTRETETETPDPAVWRDCRCVVGVQLGK